VKLHGLNFIQSELMTVDRNVCPFVHRNWSDMPDWFESSKTLTGLTGLTGLTDYMKPVTIFCADKFDCYLQSLASTY
jgi:hypothetical protein